jgi:small multidrug resistance family-3 protein
VILAEKSPLPDGYGDLFLFSILMTIGMERRPMVYTILLFLFAGLAEIGGGYLVWLWLREGKPSWYGLAGSLILILYGIIPTLQKFPSFGRVYAAYGGVFIVLSILWGWGVDKKAPDFYDWLGAAICIIGVSIILWAPRH